MQTLPTGLSASRSLPAGPPLRGQGLACNPQEATDAMNYLFPPVDRSDWIKLATAAKRAGVSFEDFLAWSSSGEGFENERRCRTDWNGISENGDITPATLFHAARVAGWRPQSSSGPRTSPMLPPAPPREPLPETPVLNAKAQEIWDLCVPAPATHTYIEKKAGNADGLRIYPVGAPALVIQGQNVAGWLVVPCVSAGLLQTLQFIPQEGPKLNMPGGTFNDGYHVVGSIGDGSTIYVVEGIGQAWACQQATGSPAACTFGAGRMTTVAQAIARAYPSAKIVLVPDRGQEGPAETIAHKLDSEWVKMPTGTANNYDANDLAQEHGNDALRDLLMQVQTPPLHYKLLTAEQLSRAAPLEWIVRGILPKKGLAGLYGPSGSYKTFVMLDLAAHIAGGGPEWFGKRVMHCPVTYCVLEGEAGMNNRAKAWSQHHGKPLPDQLRFVVQPVHLVGGDDVHQLAKAIRHVGGMNGVVILDTLNRATPGTDENSSKEMGTILAAAKQLQELIDGLVILVHHTGKDETKGLRGHSSLFAALDGAIGVIKSGTNPSWTVAKSKDDATGAVYSFRAEVVTLGIDDEGDEVTSCVIVPVGVPFALRESKALSANQQTALDALHDLFNGIGEVDVRVALGDAVKAVAAVIDTDAKHKNQRAKEAIEGLIKKSLIYSDETHLWAQPN
ncbi:AAA family ATPase [Rugamonas apoptosis]|uniref:AAA family ATPase n=1 Tax=Rugamonas apoptosis TaxID=2758570 RepID=A0A7W2F7U2_9BURK|nr:AAA family ATPase [Rugamonas apoptosis]MBA5686708.1 AAA family ATPase [Rugamonas apoptosis]